MAMNIISKTIRLASGLCIVLLVANTAMAAGDADRGKKIFKKCIGCHQVGEGAKNRTGPVLTGVVGRKAGTYPGYSYGKSMRQLAKTGLVWSEENLDGWLTDPKKYLRKVLDTRKAKAKMRLKLKKPQDRLDVIAYLKTFSIKAEAATMPMKTDAAEMTKPAMVIAATDICVENQSGKTLLFVVEAKGGERVVKTLKTSEYLCTPQAMNDAGGTVGVFVDVDALEGCSRLAKAGKAERLVSYAPFDNCNWLQ